MTPTTSDADALFDWLYELHGPALKWDIETAAAFTACLGHPHRRYISAHVAGTNGKGSVSAMIHAIAHEAGLVAGLFTSPHLVGPEERIRLGAGDIDQSRLVELLVTLRRRAAVALAAGELPRHPSFFEMMTAAAMLAFAERPVDLAVFETGLGGRLDATNVIHPALAVITTISRDHTKSLGGSIEAIAGEKAGVIKPGIPLLVGWLDAAPRRVIDRRAHRLGAPLHDAAEQIALVEHDDGRFSVTTPEDHYENLRCALDGRHQRRNAALAVRAAELLRVRGVPLEPGAVRRGLAAVRWPGRLEAIPGAPAFLLDAAHNAEGCATLAGHLSRTDAAGSRPSRRVLLSALTDGRDPVGLLSPLAPLVDAVVLTRADTPRAQDPEEMRAALARAGVDGIAEATLDEGLRRAGDLAGPHGQVIVAGSLYLVGDVRRRLLGLSGRGHPRRERVPDLDGVKASVDLPQDPAAVGAINRGADPAASSARRPAV